MSAAVRRGMRRVAIAGLVGATTCRPEPVAIPPSAADDVAHRLQDELDAPGEPTTEPQPPSTPEATSLGGAPLLRPQLPDEAYAERYEKWQDAKTRHEASPQDVDAIVWLGRRAAYLGRYREAVAIYTAGLELHEDEPHLLRHRGHRRVTLRDFEGAERDLQAATRAIEGRPDEIEQDGLPNAAGIPTGTLHTNIFYHQGLALFVQQRFEEALVAYARCEAAATTDDMRVAVSHWRYMAQRRIGGHDAARRQVAPFAADLPILENHAYLRLLMLYKGELSPEQVLPPDADDLDRATMGFGVGHYFFVEGDTDRALEHWRAVIATGHWAAFGYIAAEAELHRMGLDTAG